MSDDKDWRLRAALQDAGDPHGALSSLVERLRERRVVGDVEAAVSHDVVITHDGSELFAYAADESLLAQARGAIEQTLRDDGIAARVSVSHWDDERDEWNQVDPPLSADEQRTRAAAQARDDELQTRTVVASAGKMIRGEFEQSLSDWAAHLGVQCEVIEHPHLLTTQVAFTVTGSRRKVGEFLDAVRAEENATIRTERAVMLSPL